jgi:hypothetical protein
MNLVRLARWLTGPLALVAALTGCASHAGHHAAGSPRTVTRTFHAYDSSGQLAVRVGDVAAGTCWTASIAAPGAHAYRCISQNAILDPCFAPPEPAATPQVACLATPWSAAEVLQVNRPLPPTTQPQRPARPWAIELAHGVRCVVSTGTVPQIRGTDLGYHCTNGWDADLRTLRTARATAYYGNAATHELRVVGVTTIWRV